MTAQQAGFLPVRAKKSLVSFFLLQEGTCEGCLVGTGIPASHDEFSALAERLIPSPLSVVIGTGERPHLEDFDL